MKKLYIILSLIYSAHSLFAQENINWNELGYSYISNNVKIPPSPNAASFTRYGDFNVSHYTGSANVNIPLFNLGDEALSMPVALNYSTSGVKVDDLPGWVGLGWNISAGGVINRTVVGNPDLKFNYYGSNSPWPTHWVPWTDLINENKFRDSLSRGFVEAQPDIYSFNAGGLSGRFIIKKDKTILFENREGLTVNVTYISLNDDISQIAITDLNGYTYTFSAAEKTSFYVLSEGIIFASNFYSFNSAWYLTSISHYNPNEGQIVLSYKTIPGEQTNFTSPYALKTITLPRPWPPVTTDCCDDNGIQSLALWNEQKIQSRRIIDTITFKKGGQPLQKLVFNTSLSTSPYSDGNYKIDNIKLFDMKFHVGYTYPQKTFTFNYNNSTNRLTLTQVYEGGKNGAIHPPYLFTYESGSLPEPFDNDIDFWGYYNGSGPSGGLINGECNITPSGDGNRYPNFSFAKVGTLNRIDYPTGGYQQFFFEAHTVASYYVDLDQTPCSQLSTVGGVRVSKIENHLKSGQVAEVREFNYLKTDGTTSGISLNDIKTSKAITREHGAQDCNFPGCQCSMGYACQMRVSTANSINPRNVFEGGHIGYSRVEEVLKSNSSSATNGKTVYEFINEMYYPQNLVRNGELTVKTVYDNTTPTPKIVEKTTNTYFLDLNSPVDPEYRGFSAESSDVQSMNYTMICYTPPSTYVWTLPTQSGCAGSYNFDSRLDRGPKLYKSKWNYITETKVSTYSEESGVATPIDKIIKYEYGDPVHKLPTKVSIVNSDGLEHILEYTYNFTPPASYNLPVEVKKSTKSGGITTLRYSYKTNYATINGNYKPSTIQEKFGIGAYVNIEELLAYNTSGKLQEAKETNNQENAYLWWYDTRLMTGVVQNAKNNEVCYSSFEVPMLEALSTGWITNTSQYLSGVNAGATGNGYYKGGASLLNNARPVGKYILSYFTKSPTLSDIGITAASGSALTVMMRKISSQYASGWYYVEAVINITSGGQLSLNFGSTTYIDELRLYPYDALMQTFTYDYRSSHIISTCDQTGKTMRYDYDDLDRLIGIYNHDNHFVQVNEYNYTSPTFEPNTIVNRSVLSSGNTTYGTVVGLTGANVIRTFNYFDGLGRPLQSVKLDNSPASSDVFNYSVYDQYGRQALQYLPFNKNTVNTTYSTVYDASAASDQISFYNTLYAGQGSVAYQQTLFDLTPLNRTKGVKSAGTAFQSFPSNTDYWLNDADDVRILTSSASPPANFYPANTFYKTRNIDEDGKITIVYTDKIGQKIMEDVGGAMTYYMYNEMGLVTQIIQPEGSKILHTTVGTTNTTASVIRHSFLYTYDGEYRLATKSIPGTTGNYSYAYDRLDRQVLQTDPNGFKTFTKYDVLGRVIVTGKYTGSSTPTGSESLFENRTTTGDFYTSNLAFPTSLTVSYTTNYFDDYNFNFDASYVDDVTYQSAPSAGITYNSTTFASNHPATEFHNFTRGLTTGNKVAVLKNDGTNPTVFVSTYPFYDKFERTIQTKTNHPFSGADIDWVKYNFPGWEMARSREHKSILGGTAVNQFILTTNTYDHAGRKLSKAITLNSGSAVTVSQASYNELSQISLNNLGSGIQNVDYKYNIRSWLTDINDVGGCGTDAFSLKLNYETPNTTLDGTHVGCRNGNISSIEWRTGVGCSVGGVTRNKAIYDYFYDTKNRLTKARYGEITGTTNLDNYTFDNVTYNDNGDILTSQTRGKNGGVFGLIDNLAYTLSSSGAPRLNSVQDNAVTTLGFTTTASNIHNYTYDNNGNLTGRTNTTFTTIDYNHLNQPRKFIGSGPNLVENTYDATGRKWQTTQIGNNTYYFDDLEYVGTTPTIYHDDGRIVSLGGGNWEYNYYVKDHLGNTRVVVKGPSGSAVLMQEYHYYPFGMGMDGTWVTPTGTTEKYRYNGKEFVQNNLNMYDYGARWYDPCIGRMINVDPMSENTPGFSGYTYVFNNPIRMTDPTGMVGVGVNAWDHDIENPKGRVYEETDGGDTPVPSPFGILYESYLQMEAAVFNFMAKGAEALGYGEPGINIRKETQFGENGEIYGNEIVKKPEGSWTAALIETGGDLLALIPVAGKIKELTAGILAAKTPAKSAIVAEIKGASIAEQAEELQKSIGGKNSITLNTPRQQIRYDLAGKDHGGIPTPHVQVYNKNFVAGQVRSISRASKNATPMTQEEIRLLRNYLSKIGN